MTNHPRRSVVAQAKRAAEAAGYYVLEGSYIGTTDDRLGRHYYGRKGEFFRPYGAGHASRGDAWIAAAEHVSHPPVQA